MENNETKSPRKLFRSNKDKMIAGICGGIAEYFNADTTIVRLVFVLITFMTGIFPIALTYFIAWAIIPQKEVDSGTEV